MFKSNTILSGNNAKTVKGDGTQYETAIMYLAPYKISGKGNVCANAGLAQCHVGCLFRAGRGRMSNVENARVNKTARYFENRQTFMDGLAHDVYRFEAKCKRANIKPVVRLNGTSDIQFEIAHPVNHNGKFFDSIFEAFPNVQFYDYTKIWKRCYRELPNNYSLVMSYSAANPRYAIECSKAFRKTGCNLAVVFRSKEIVQHAIKHGWSTLNGSPIPVLDGDKNDLRFLDPRGHIVALTAKGPAKRDATGFVIDI